MSSRSAHMHEKIAFLTKFAVLAAIEFIVCFTPLGTIQIGPIAATLSHIPVIIAAVVLGTKAGAAMGGLFGLCSFIYWTFVLPNTPTAFMFTPFFALGDIHGSAWSLVICFVPRILIGIVSGEVYRFIRSRGGRDGVAYALSGALGSLTATALVLGLTYSLIGRNYVLAVFADSGSAAPDNLFGWLLSVIWSTVLVNGIPELVLGAVITVAVGFALIPRKRVIGMDIGSSTTKIALVRGKSVLSVKRFENGTPIEEMLKAFDLSGVTCVHVTGVGSAEVPETVLGLPTEHCDEFRSLARGATILSGKNNFIICSVGTGTSFVRVTPFYSRHLGGSGVGGGMLAGLSQKMFGTFDPEALLISAKNGDLSKVDLILSDVCSGTISNLNPDTTVANLYKAAEADDAALAHGLYNLIFQSIGVMGAFAAKSHLTRTVVICGTILEHQPVAQQSLDAVAELHPIKFIVPDHAAFVTAIGAAAL